MAKKSTAKKKAKKTSRLGHDPLDDLNADTIEKESDQTQSIEPNEDIIKMESNDTPSTLHLPSRFSIAEVAEVREHMSSIMKQKQTTIEVDAGEVELVDTAAIQLLHAFSEQAKTSGKTLHWQSQSEKIKEASRMLNINISMENK